MPVSHPQSWWRSFNRYHWTIFIVASLAWLFDCLDQQVFNLSRTGAVEDLITDKARATEFASYTTSFFLVGWAIGGLIFGSLGDRFGRARVLAWCLFIYSICTGICAFSTYVGYWGFCACLFMTGLGIGGVFGLSVALVADSVPDASRAPALGMLQSLSSWGNITAAFGGMAIGVLAGKGIFHMKPWQMMFLAGSIPAFLCAFVVRRTKEPEKWVLARADAATTGIKFGSYATLLKHPTWSRHAWLGLILCCSGIIGLWGIGNFHPTIIASITQANSTGLSKTELASKKAYWSSVGLLLQNIGGFLGMLSAAKFAQVKGRRPAFVFSLSLSFLSSLLVFRYLREINQIYWMLPIMGFGQFTVFGVYAIYLPELFPTSLRSTGTSFCYNFGRLLAATAPFTLGRITKGLGGNIEGFRTAGTYVCFVLLVGIFVLPFLPETKGQPLPE